eukprot:m.124822 g.124822  ORF g.124822 m.124822 type:complete len:105 (-) comp15602_c0_seq1:1364-1678(-)
MMRWLRLEDLLSYLNHDLSVEISARPIKLENKCFGFFTVLSVAVYIAGDVRPCRLALTWNRRQCLLFVVGTGQKNHKIPADLPLCFDFFLGCVPQDIINGSISV